MSFGGPILSYDSPGGIVSPFANNGLNVNAGVIQMGGDLIEETIINADGFAWTIEETGGVGEIFKISDGADFPIQFLHGAWELDPAAFSLTDGDLVGFTGANGRAQQITPSNGITAAYGTTPARLKFGGTLIENTTIDQDNNTLEFQMGANGNTFRISGDSSDDAWLFTAANAQFPQLQALSAGIATILLDYGGNSFFRMGTAGTFRWIRSGSNQNFATGYEGTPVYGFMISNGESLVMERLGSQIKAFEFNFDGNPSINYFHNSGVYTKVRSSGNGLQVFEPGVTAYAVTIRQINSYGAPTGTATRTTFDTATVTLPQLAERVKAIIDDFQTLNFFGTI